MDLFLRNTTLLAHPIESKLTRRREGGIGGGGGGNGVGGFARDHSLFKSKVSQSHMQLHY